MFSIHYVGTSLTTSFVPYWSIIEIFPNHLQAYLITSIIVNGVITSC